MSKLTDLEIGCYRGNGKTIYFSELALLTVFTDCTERSPTFSLKPLDTKTKEDENNSECWIKARLKTPTKID
jgi:hypothetical protein